jgi:hypothetical protein
VPVRDFRQTGLSSEADRVNKTCSRLPRGLCVHRQESPFQQVRDGLLQVIGTMVELTGIEPVASSLRTRMSLLVTRSNHNT